nr:hypothetical protein Iba_chr14bCG15680 [Ipomoea batatas]
MRFADSIKDKTPDEIRNRWLAGESQLQQSCDGSTPQCPLENDIESVVLAALPPPPPPTAITAIKSSGKKYDVGCFRPKWLWKDTYNLWIWEGPGYGRMILGAVRCGGGGAAR